MQEESRKEKTMVGIYGKLLMIQERLSVPKGHYNEFGGFYYRSLEDIQNAVKPLLKETNTVLRISDEIVMVGNRFYVKATALLIDCETGEKVENVAYAREDEQKPKMDGAQLTGSSSSYARKYALNGLFCIDDAQDPDARKGEQEGQLIPDDRKKPMGKQNGNGNNPKKGQKKNGISQENYEAIIGELRRTGISTKSLIEQYRVYNLRDLTEQQYREAMEQLKAQPDRQKDQRSGRTFGEIVNRPPEKEDPGVPWYSERR